MRRFHPFVVGQIGGGLIVYGLGTLWDPSFAIVVVLLPLAGALIGCLVCRWRPGFDAGWWKLMPVAGFTNLGIFMAGGGRPVSSRSLVRRRRCPARIVACPTWR